ncbi:MAG: VanZ family protein [Dorea sp.]|jgi:VanZ family protein|nr:VanZ family protein [Dorea sp.]
MKKVVLFFLKPLSFLPALFMMYAIYSFSAQTGEVSGNLSYTVSYKIVEIGDQALDIGLQEDQISYYAGRIEYPVRKLAHMTEYFLLAVAVSFPFYVYGLRGFPLMLVAGLICVGFAAGDEYHQSFVAGRGPSKKDVMIDSIGVFAGIITVRIICWTFLAPFRIAKRLERRARRKEMSRRRSGTF